MKPTIEHSRTTDPLNHDFGTTHVFLIALPWLHRRFLNVRISFTNLPRE